MHPLLSLLTGFLLLPWLDFLLRLAGAESLSAAAALPKSLLAVGGAALLGSMAGDRRRLGVVLLLLAGALGLLAGAYEREHTLVAAALLLALTGAGLGSIGGGKPSFGWMLIGAALATVAVEWCTLQRFGFAGWIALGIPLLAAVRVRAARLDRPGPESSLQLVDLLAWGVLAGGALALARPYLLQHVDGGRASEATFAAVALCGLGLGALLGALLPGRGRLRTLVRAFVPIVALATLVDLFALLRGGSDARAMAQAPFYHHPDVRLEELGIALVLLARVSAGFGAWLAVAARGGGAAGAGTVAFAGLALGLVLGGKVHRAALPWPSALLGDARDLIRAGPLENIQDFRVIGEGVLRQAVNPALREHRPHLLWDGRRSTYPEEFALLQKDQVTLAGSASPSGGAVLLVGTVDAQVRAGLGATPFTAFDELPLAATFPFDAAPGERVRAPFDLPLAHELPNCAAVVVLASCSLNTDEARVLSPPLLARLRALAPRLILSLDLRTVPPKAAGAILRSLPESAKCYLLLDGYAGPFVVLADGPDLPDSPGPRGTMLSRQALLSCAAGTSSALHPVAEARPPRAFQFRPLADAEGLRDLARGVGSGDEVVRELLLALAVHSERYIPSETEQAPKERHVLVDEEFEHLAAALRKEPGNALVQNQSRLTLQLAVEKKEYTRANMILEPMLAHAPDDAGLRFVSGQVNFELLDYENAVADLEVAVRAEKTEFKSYLYLGRAYAELGDFPAALSALESARGLKPEDLDVLRALGLTLVKAGRAHDAIPYLERVAAERSADGTVKAALEKARAG